MKPTGDKIFIDTNVLIYGYSADEPDKQLIVQKLVTSQSMLYPSTQVINEFSNVMLRKSQLSVETLLTVVQELEDRFYIAQIDTNTIAYALQLAQRYHYSYFDSLMIASAIQTGCNLLYTEDLHDRHQIQSQLTIINPFKGQ